MKKDVRRTLRAMSIIGIPTTALAMFVTQPNVPLLVLTLVWIGMFIGQAVWGAFDML